jgi:hypothetical protein
MLDDFDTLHFAGHVLRAVEDDFDDCNRVSHLVMRPDGEVVRVPFTPYERMSYSAFQTFVEMGCPESTRDLVGSPNTYVNFDNASLKGLRVFAEDNGVRLSNLDGLKTLLKLRAK